MAEMQSSVQLVVTVKFRLGLWAAFKLRLAGPELREKLVDEIILNASASGYPDDRS